MTMLPDSAVLVIAAHGVPGTNNAAVERLARAVARRVPAARVLSAYHRGHPGFAEAIECLEGPVKVVVVPLFTSDGHYVRSVLSREVARARRAAGVDITMAPPVGVHPGAIRLVAGYLGQEANAFLSQRGAELLVVGHGTGRSETSHRAATDLARALGDRVPQWRVSAVFLDQAPRVEDLAARSRGPLVVFPFLIGGSHVDTDLPGRLGASKVASRRRPLTGSVPGQAVMITRPFGEIPGIAALIESSFRGALATVA